MNYDIIRCLLMLFGLGNMFISYICLYFIVHSSPFLCECGDDRMTCYPGADDVTGGSADT